LPDTCGLDVRVAFGHYRSVPDYGSFARFYDALMDDPRPKSNRVLEAIDKYLPEASSLLELGCGTGAILAGLSSLPSLTGLDRSPEMLAIARDKVPQARLIEGDIATFYIGERFDVVMCVFDTLNHLPSFSLWNDLFERTNDHLVEGGLFIFDVNPIGELRQLGEARPWVQDFDGNTVIMDVQLDHDDLWIWEIKVFEHVGEDRFTLHHERIREFGVGLGRIESALAPRFTLLEVTDPVGGVPNDDSARAYFVARRR
jgi:SAM-dependent methyltransferase